jgi:hypothetical protein
MTREMSIAGARVIWSLLSVLAGAELGMLSLILR